jgi:hypothetical protein
MPKTLLVLPVLVSLFTLLMPARAVAELPEEGSGQMVVDEVREGLQQYQKEKDVGKRIKLLEKLAPTRDSRVAVMLGDVLDGPIIIGEDGRAQNRAEHTASHLLLKKYYLPPQCDQAPHDWFKRNEADLRRRAMQLPQ